VQHTAFKATSFCTKAARYWGAFAATAHAGAKTPAIKKWKTAGHMLEEQTFVELLLSQGASQQLHNVSKGMICC